MIATLYLNIGSNNGDRREYISRAVAELFNLFPGYQIRKSKEIETEPWGFDSPNKFLNIGVTIKGEFDTSKEGLLTLLHNLQTIESKIGSMPHRHADGSYADRQLDIDIIALDNVCVNYPELTIPHPRMHLRDFVLIPMAELAPGWKHPNFLKSKKG